MRRKASEAGTPEISPQMAAMVIPLLMWFSMVMMGVTGFPTKNDNFEELQKQFRRSLLANGLGNTPPMG